MKYFVNNHCIGCGLCTVICPSVFFITDNNVAESTWEDVLPEDLTNAQHALDNCPVYAIEEMA